MQLLRFFAASLIVLFHKYNSGNKLIDFFIGRGDVAVSFFFILSGFVITKSLLRKSSTFKEFIFSRSLKIMPQWLLSISISVLLAGGFGVSFFRVLLSIMLLQTVYPAYSLDLNFVGWSLSVELIMYIILFLILKLVNVNSAIFRSLVWIIWLITQIVFSVMMHSQTNDDVQSYFLYYHPVWHLSSFLMGILSAVSSDKIKGTLFSKVQYSVLLVSAVYITIMYCCFYIGYRLGFNRFYHNGFFAPLNGVYLILLTNIEKARSNFGLLRVKKLFDVLGGISFGIYLFHIPIYNYVSTLCVIGDSGIVFWLYFFLLLIFSYFVYIFFDGVLHGLANRFLLKLRVPNGSE